MFEYDIVLVSFLLQANRMYLKLSNRKCFVIFRHLPHYFKLFRTSVPIHTGCSPKCSSRYDYYAKLGKVDALIYKNNTVYLLFQAKHVYVFSDSSVICKETLKAYFSLRSLNRKVIVDKSQTCTHIYTGTRRQRKPSYQRISISTTIAFDLETTAHTRL